VFCYGLRTNDYGRFPRFTALSNSIIIVDGDFTRATGLDNCAEVRSPWSVVRSTDASWRFATDYGLMTTDGSGKIRSNELDITFGK
jgi:hypothetical protein